MTDKQVLLVKILSLIVFMLAVIHVCVWLFLATGDVIDSPNLVRYFDLDSEQNIPTAFSAVLFMILSWRFIRLAKYESKTNFVSRNHIYFIFCFAGSVLAGIDELFELHELLIDPVYSIFPESYLWKHAWVIPGIVIAITFLYTTRSIWQRLPNKIKKWGLIGICAFITGAGGFEFIGGIYIASGGNIIIYKFITLIEEVMEMMGVIIIITTAYLYLNSLINSEAKN